MNNQIIAEAIRTATGAHGIWKARFLSAAHSGVPPEPVHMIADGDQCAFGRLLRALEPVMSRDPDYREIRRMHAGFHRYAEGLARAIASGDTEDLAFELCDGGGFDQRARAFTARLADWRISLTYGR